MQTLYYKEDYSAPNIQLVKAYLLSKSAFEFTLSAYDYMVLINIY